MVLINRLGNLQLGKSLVPNSLIPALCSWLSARLSESPIVASHLNPGRTAGELYLTTFKSALAIFSHFQLNLPNFLALLSGIDGSILLIGVERGCRTPARIAG